MKRLYLVALVGGLVSCSPRPAADNVSDATENTAEAQAPTGDTLSLLKAGDPKACATQEVKDLLIADSAPSKPDDMTESDWEAATQSVSVSLKTITADEVNSAAGFVDCSAQAEISGETLKGAIRYRVSTDLSDPTKFAVRADTDAFKSFFGGMMYRAADIWKQGRGMPLSPGSQQVSPAEDGRAPQVLPTEAPTTVTAPSAPPAPPAPPERHVNMTPAGAPEN